ncbi:MAG: hypothetical protein WHS38_10110 [Thermodesulforhabdaceae bacterium]|jgi:hypothetical protein
MGRFMVPLKFSDGELVKNTEQLKKKYNSCYIDIIKFIESGEFERFFYGLAKDQIKDQIASMKQSGISSAEIAKSIAEALEIQLSDDIEKDFVLNCKESIVRSIDDLKSVLEGGNEDLIFPTDLYREKSEIVIKRGKKN